MPFQSKKQQRKCYAMKSKGQAGSWDCDEWSDHTDFKKLPEKKKEAIHFGAKLACRVFEKKGQGRAPRVTPQVYRNTPYNPYSGPRRQPNPGLHGSGGVFRNTPAPTTSRPAQPTSNIHGGGGVYRNTPYRPRNPAPAPTNRDWRQQIDDAIERGNRPRVNQHQPPEVPPYNPGATNPYETTEAYMNRRFPVRQQGVAHFDRGQGRYGPQNIDTLFPRSVASPQHNYMANVGMSQQIDQDPDSLPQLQYDPQARAIYRQGLESGPSPASRWDWWQQQFNRAASRGGADPATTNRAIDARAADLQNAYRGLNQRRESMDTYLRGYNRNLASTRGASSVGLGAMQALGGLGGIGTAVAGQTLGRPVYGNTQIPGGRVNRGAR